MDLEITLKQLYIEIDQLEQDIIVLKEMKRKPEYKDCKLQFTKLIRTLFFKKQTLKVKAALIYKELLEWSDFISKIEY